VWPQSRVRELRIARHPVQWRTGQRAERVLESFRWGLEAKDEGMTTIKVGEACGPRHNWVAVIPSVFVIQVDGY
jgi:hypothetical protein